MTGPRDSFARSGELSAAHVDMSHGSGGKASRRLIQGLILPELDNPALAALSDAALLRLGGTGLAFTTDAFVVRPLQFPGGSVGELAVNGTVNDLAVSGARPVALSAALIVEEGLETAVLRREVAAMGAAARRAGVAIVTGDTKVVERGKGDGLYIVTSGVGLPFPGAALGSDRIRPGDRILCSGTLGDHGIAVLVARGELDLETDLRSDTRPLTELSETLWETAGEGLRFMRDPTRGGVATVLNELAIDSGLGITLWEASVPVREEVQGACEILGLDPLYVANEGKLLAVLSPETAGPALEAVRSLEGGRDAALIGEVTEAPPGRVLLETSFGGRRVVDMLVGDPLPRIC